MAGLKTCLVIHSPDTTAEYLLNCKIGTSPIRCKDNLSAVRLETTKVRPLASLCFYIASGLIVYLPETDVSLTSWQMLLEPLKQLQEADSRLNMTNGVLEGVGMWSVFWLYHKKERVWISLFEHIFMPPSPKFSRWWEKSLGCFRGWTPLFQH